MLSPLKQAMHAILTSSQSIASRFDVFSWQHPLDLQSWVRVCVQDTQAELCTTLGHKLGTFYFIGVAFFAVDNPLSCAICFHRNSQRDRSELGA